MNNKKCLRIGAQGYFLLKGKRKEQFNSFKIGYCNDINDFNSKVAEYETLAKMKFIESGVKLGKWHLVLNECELTDDGFETVTLYPVHRTSVNEYSRGV